MKLTHILKRLNNELLAKDVDSVRQLVEIRDETGTQHYEIQSMKVIWENDS